jgi:hypothetical protein
MRVWGHEQKKTKEIHNMFSIGKRQKFGAGDINKCRVQGASINADRS